MMNSSVSPSCDFRSITKTSALPDYIRRRYVEMARSEKSYYCYIHMPIFPIVWLLRDLRLGGKSCLRVEKNAVSV